MLIKNFIEYWSLFSLSWNLKKRKTSFSILSFSERKLFSNSRKHKILKSKKFLICFETIVINNSYHFFSYLNKNEETSK